MEDPNDGDARVQGADGLARLCEELRDEASLAFSGTPTEQARAREAHAQRRQAALGGRYVAVVPGSGYQFRHYEPGERKLPIDTSRSLVLGEGAELFLSNPDSTPGFPVDANGAERILAQRRDDEVALRLRFRPVKSGLRRDVCSAKNGGRVIGLAVEIFDMALLGSDGKVLARTDSQESAGSTRGKPVPSIAPAAASPHPVAGAAAASATLTPVRSPAVVASNAQAASGRKISFLTEALGVLAERARPCYERALVEHPALRGSLVLGIRIDADQQVASVRVELRALADDGLVRCVAASALKATIIGTTAGQGLSVTLQFGSADD